MKLITVLIFYWKSNVNNHLEYDRAMVYDCIVFHTTITNCVYSKTTHMHIYWDVLLTKYNYTEPQED